MLNDFKSLKPLLALFLTLLFASEAVSQRVSYQMLALSNRAPSSYVDYIYTPGEDGKTQVHIVFRVNHDFLNFRRTMNTVDDVAKEQFVSELEIMFDFYEKGTPLIPDRPFIDRKIWRKTVIVDNYEATQSTVEYVSGHALVELPPEDYRVITTISINGNQVSGPGMQSAMSRRPSGPMANQGSRRDRARARQMAEERGMIRVPNFSEANRAQIILIEDFKNAEAPLPVLKNMGRNVLYARDYSVILSIPSQLEADSVSLQLTETGPTSDSRNRNQVWSSRLSEDMLWSSKKLHPEVSGKAIEVRLSDNTSSQNHYIVHIPNHRFRNAWFELKALAWKDGVSSEITRSNYLSRWVDIPSSLLNLDVAIENLKYLISNDELRQMRRGSNSEKEARFIEFWKKRDPTPDTDFNELMTEYYRRIDHAYKNFTTPSTPGHESDQGKVYIVYGPPDSVERRFPSPGATQEVWQYGSRTFIFTATSGFGDFQLVSSS